MKMIVGEAPIRPPLSLVANSVDIGFRSRIHLSSAFPGERQPDRLYPCLAPGGYSFHTGLDNPPWVVIDLGRPRVIGQIGIWNREHHGFEGLVRALPLSISASDDGSAWRQVAQIFDIFSGRTMGHPCKIPFSFGLAARYIRLSVERETYLHLDYVEVTQFLPHTIWGYAINLAKDGNGVVSCEYIFTTNHGLYSNLSTMLEDILILNRYGIAVRSIDLSLGFENFKNEKHKNVFDVFFAQPEFDQATTCQAIEFESADVHRIYKRLPLGALKAVAANIFPPSAAVLNRVGALRSSSGIVPSRTILILYRGTDKSTEVTLATPEAYIEVARRLLNADPDLDVFIQTDQEQARTAVIAAFPGKVRYFDELPVTRTSTAIHNLAFGTEIPTHREAFATDMMAAALICAECRHVITHSGNVGLWVAIYRGHAENLYQFDADARLVEPD